ncbi:pyrokinin-1 receptor-like [Cydia pomonella]|uniref:pyrokinin-1 receptor-like n=1 Tax=Cydia pomonella TaxID=82600 RepID=UPI002ADE8B7F|nr:pyrokinin-1 receptor-like [Cydia pomonella]
MEDFKSNISRISRIVNDSTFLLHVDFGPHRDPMYILLPITIIYSVIFATGLFGNIITCTVIVRDRTMHTTTNCYLFNLAISDIIFLLFGVPYETYWLWWKWPYPFDPAFCPIRALISETSTNVSVMTITLFTIERYLAICFPFLSRKMAKTSRAAKQLVALWIVALISALPGALEFGVSTHIGITTCHQVRTIVKHYFEISTFLFFLAPMVLITILCCLIGLALKKSDLSKDKPNVTLEMRVTAQVQEKHSQSTRRVIKMLVAVVVTFFICWAPFHAQRLLIIYATSNGVKFEQINRAITILTYVSGVFYYLSTCINPILYHIMSNKFREAFKNTLMQCCRRGARS